jgi:hypothetical protein
MKSSNFMQKSNTPQYFLHDHPHSSLSQNYDPYEASHKRRVSLANQNRNYILDEAK